MRSLLQGGMLARLSNAHTSTLFSASAWTLAPGPAYQGGVDLRPLSSPLLTACNDAISQPQVQAQIHAEALALARSRGSSTNQNNGHSQAQARAGTRTREQQDWHIRKEATASGLAVWRVVYDPHVAVRDKPKGT